MKKKLMISLMAMAMLFSMVVGSASAASGWQVIKQFPISHFDNSSLNFFTSGIFYEQDGGNLAIQITDHLHQSGAQGTNAFIEVWLYEDDGSLAPDLLGYWRYFPSLYKTETLTPYVSNIQNARDGTNNEAELYIKLKSNYDSSDFYVKVLD